MPMIKASGSMHGQAFWDASKSSFGYKMMSKMGWQEGQGLGAEGTGIKRYLKTKKKDDKSGIGANRFTNDEMFRTTMFMYNDILENLNVKKPSSDTDSDSSDEDEKPSLSTGASLQKYKAKASMQRRFRKARYSDMVKKESKATDSKALFARAKATTHSSPRAKAAENNGEFAFKTSGSNIREYFAKRLSDKKDAKRSEFSMGSATGFSLNKQACFYTQQRSLHDSRKGRMGLGFGGGDAQPQPQITYTDPSWKRKETTTAKRKREETTTPEPEQPKKKRKKNKKDKRKSQASAAADNKVASPAAAYSAAWRDMDPADWSREEVAGWLTQLDGSMHKTAKTFYDKRVTGKVLLKLDRQDLKATYPVKKSKRRSKIMTGIKELGGRSVPLLTSSPEPAIIERKSTKKKSKQKKKKKNRLRSKEALERRRKIREQRSTNLEQATNKT